jgi:hypothetical protein
MFHTSRQALTDWQLRGLVVIGSGPRILSHALVTCQDWGIWGCGMLWEDLVVIFIENLNGRINSLRV